jgi:hypothetical protein
MTIVTNFETPYYIMVRSQLSKVQLGVSFLIEKPRRIFIACAKQSNCINRLAGLNCRYPLAVGIFTVAQP